MEFTIKDNISEFTKGLDDFHKRQVPFAASKAMNDTAIDAQEATVKMAKLKFKNRKKWFIKGSRRTGIRVKFSRKNQLKAEVYTDAYFAQLQEKGGTKSPRNGSSIAVPTSKAPKNLQRSDGVKRALSKPKTFSNKQGVFKRVGKKGMKKLFNWTKTAQVKPRFKFEQTAQATVKRKFNRHFKKRLEQAIKTARV